MQNETELTCFSLAQGDNYSIDLGAKDWAAASAWFTGLQPFSQQPDESLLSQGALQYKRGGLALRRRARKRNVTIGRALVMAIEKKDSAALHTAQVLVDVKRDGTCDVSVCADALNNRGELAFPPSGFDRMDRAATKVQSLFRSHLASQRMCIAAQSKALAIEAKLRAAERDFEQRPSSFGKTRSRLGSKSGTGLNLARVQGSSDAGQVVRTARQALATALSVRKAGPGQAQSVYDQLTARLDDPSSSYSAGLAVESQTFERRSANLQNGDACFLHTIPDTGKHKRTVAVIVMDGGKILFKNKKKDKTKLACSSVSLMTFGAASPIFRGRPSDVVHLDVTWCCMTLITDQGAVNVSFADEDVALSWFLAIQDAVTTTGGGEQARRRRVSSSTTVAAPCGCAPPSSSVHSRRRSS
jgi:hypothetical protein